MAKKFLCVKLLTSLFIIAVLVFATGCEPKKDNFGKDRTKDLLTRIESEKNSAETPKPRKIETPQIVITKQPDMLGWPRAPIYSRENQDPNSPLIKVEVLNRWSNNNTYFLLVSFENVTPRQGNMSINVYHFDKNDRMVNLSSQVFYFRPYQQYIRRYDFGKGTDEVRWLINVSE